MYDVSKGVFFIHITMQIHQIRRMLNQNYGKAPQTGSGLAHDETLRTTLYVFVIVYLYFCICICVFVHLYL